MAARNITAIERYIIEQIIRKTRERGWRYIDLAEHLGIKESTIKHKCSYRSAFNVRQINKLSKLFECSPKSFFPDKPL